MNGRTNVAVKVLSRGIGVNISRNGITPLLAAVKHSGNIEIIHLLLSMGADVNIKDIEGKTPVVIAREKGRTDLVKMLEAGSATR